MGQIVPQARFRSGWVRLLVAALLVLQGTAAPAAGASVQDEAARALEAGLAALERGDWQAATAALERAASFPGAPPEASLYLGVARWRSGDLEAAGEALAEAAAQRPDDAQPHLLLGLVRFEERRIDVARKSLRRAAALDPDSPVVHLALARLYLNLLQFDLAEAALARAASLEPGSAAVHTARGLLGYRQGRLDEAATALQEALASAPEDLEARFNLAVIRLQLGEPVAAEAEVRSLLQRDPSHARGHYVLAAALAAQGRQEEAAAERTAYRKLSGNASAAPLTPAEPRAGMAGGEAAPLVSAWRLLQEAEAARLQGELPKARRLARLAMGVDAAAAAAAQRVLALIHYQEGDLAAAAQRLEGLWESGWRSPDLAHDLALILLRLGHLHRGLEVLEVALSAGEDAGLRRLQALAALEAGDASLAAVAAERAVALEPATAEAYLLLARAYEALGMEEKAAAARRRYEEMRREPGS